jgi:molybdenum cofactor synthesis domain-containing protein
MSEPAVVTAAILVIGNEILSGRTQDANVKFLATGLNEAGVRLKEVRVVPDDEVEIIEAVHALRKKYDYLFTTGGIGPTHDDITAATMAKAFGVRLLRHPEAVERIRVQCERAGIELNEARLRMANIPEGAELVENTVSGAPGFRMENVYVLAGVPMIVEAMFASLRHELTGGAPVMSRALSVRLGEGTIAPLLTEVQDRYGDVDIGSYPSYRAGKFGVSVVCRTADAARLEACIAELDAGLRELGGTPEEEDLG